MRDSAQNAITVPTIGNTIEQNRAERRPQELFSYFPAQN
jgi:hypothetical protein